MRIIDSVPDLRTKIRPSVMFFSISSNFSITPFSSSGFLPEQSAPTSNQPGRSQDLEQAKSAAVAPTVENKVAPAAATPKEANKGVENKEVGTPVAATKTKDGDKISSIAGDLAISKATSKLTDLEKEALKKAIGEIKDIPAFTGVKNEGQVNNNAHPPASDALNPSNEGKGNSRS